MLKAQNIFSTLSAVKTLLQTQFKVKSLWAFGSLVRNELTQLSDVDILVDFQENASLFDLIALNDFLQEKLHCPVDVVSLRAIRPEIKDQVFKEMIAI